ncbi:hypothetical protein EDB84DRAFT_1434658 [Lactarius hengduanensis]|nr:hypothetical protein EDB84DRAFT_1434658 [Lactarius hengduanensis]
MDRPCLSAKGEAVYHRANPRLVRALTYSSNWEQLAPESLHHTCEREHLHRIHLRSKGGLTLRLPRDIGVESTDVDTASTGAASTRSRRTPPTCPPATTAKAKILALQTNQLPEPDKCPLTLPPPTKKPKSETYKGAWSISEQHFLERLLTEIADGEKNRYKSRFRA